MTAAEFTATADFADMQFEALPSSGVWASVKEGFEESQLAVDVDATLARIERHRDEAARVSPSAGALYEAYVADRLREMRLRYHTPAEIIAPHKRVTRRGVRNLLMPPSLLPRLLVLTVVMDDERDRLGHPVRKNSIYRCLAYNADIGGARLSQHAVCTAWDAQAIGCPQRDLHAVPKAMESVRIPIVPYQLRAIERVVHDYRLGGVLTGSVRGEPFRPSGLDLDLRHGAVTVRGGQGDYRTFGHRDIRGERARWNQL